MIKKKIKKKDNIIKLLDKNGFDGAKMFSQAELGGKNSIIESNIKIAKNLGLRGTPASIINDTIFPGYVRLSKLNEITSQ